MHQSKLGQTTIAATSTVCDDLSGWPVARGVKTAATGCKNIWCPPTAATTTHLAESCHQLHWTTVNCCINPLAADHLHPQR